jgi:hypothetical protein
MVLVGNPDGKKPIGRPRVRRENNMKMALQKVECGVWTGSSWLTIGTGGCSIERGNEHSGITK